MAAENRNRLATAAVVALALWTALMAALRLRLAWGFDTDDAFITLRYARHLHEGAGLTWNVGEPPVEGYSNFAFVLAGAGFLALGIEPVVGLKVVSVLALFATCGLLYWIARRWVSPALALLPAVWLTRYDGTILWTVSGLETAVYQCLLVLTVALAIAALDRRPRSPDAAPSATASPDARLLAAAGFSAFVASLTRPEGPLVAGLVLLVVLVRFGRDLRRAEADPGATTRQHLRALLALSAAFAVPYLAYTAFRVLYFGELLPNTVQCKAAYDGPADRLVRPYVEYAALYLVLALAGLLRVRDARAMLLLGPVVVYGVILVGVDPIIGYHNRHFLAAHALVLVAAAVGVAELTQRVLGDRLATARGPLILAAVILAGAAPNVGFHPGQVRGWVQTYQQRAALRRRLAHWLDSKLDPRDQYVIGDCGLIPYLTRVRVIDAYCLNSAAMTSPPIDGSTERYIDWILQRAPEVIVVHSARPDVIAPRPEYGFYPALVRRPAFRESYAGVARFAATRGNFHYFVFGRLDRAEALAAEAEAGATPAPSQP